MKTLTCERWILLALFAGVICSNSAPVHALNTIQINTGQTITNADLMAGVFDGEAFSLGPDAVFEINSGGAIGPVGQHVINGLDIFFDFIGSTVNVNSGGAFVSNPPTPQFDPSLTTNLRLNVFPGGTVGDSFGVGDLVFGNGVSVVNIRGGETGILFDANGDTVVNIFDGQLGDRAQAFGGSEVNLYGGRIGDSYDAFSGSVLNVFGGAIGDDFDAFSGSTVNIYVRSLSINGDEVSLAPGEPYAIPIGSGNTFQLTATLADGSIFDRTVYPANVIGGTYFDSGSLVLAILVPEPSSLLLTAATGCLALARRRAVPFKHALRGLVSD